MVNFIKPRILPPPKSRGKEDAYMENSVTLPDSPPSSLSNSTFVMREDCFLLLSNQGY